MELQEVGALWELEAPVTDVKHALANGDML